MGNECESKHLPLESSQLEPASFHPSCWEPTWGLGVMYRSKLKSPSTYSCPQWHLAGGKCLMGRSVFQDGRGAEQLSCQSCSPSRKMLVLISKLILVPKDCENGWIFFMLSFSLCWRLNSRQPDAHERGKYEWTQLWPEWWDRVWLNHAVHHSKGTPLTSPVNPTHSQGGMFSVHLTFLFLILWRRMWPGNLWCTPCVKGCAPGPLCESQDKMLSAAGHNRCCTVQLWSMGRWKVEKYHKPSCVLTPLELVCICLPVGCHSLADNHTLNLFITHQQHPRSHPHPLAASSEIFWGF